MPRVARRRLLLGAFGAPVAGCATPFAAAATTAAGGELRRALQRRLDGRGVGLAAAEVDADGVRLHLLGVRQFGAAGAIESTTLFELGSLTKAFVALMLADGVLQARWRFDDPVEAVLPDQLRLRDAAGEPIRLIDLATHRSGLPRMPGNLTAGELADPYPRYDAARLFAFLRDWRPDAARGARFEYSNLGYGLLSLELARRLGLGFDDALRRTVLEPLGLGDMRLARPLPPEDDLGAVAAAIGASLALAPRLARGHDAQRSAAPPWRFDALAGAIGLLGSIESVARFMQAALGLVRHPLAAAFELCLQYRFEGSEPLHPFGLGWEISTIVSRDGTRRLFNQDGATAGFSSALWLEPARRRAGAVLANSFIETRDLALLALDPALRESDFNRMLLDPAALAPLAGRYVFNERVSIDVGVRDGRLWLQSGGQAEIELLPRSPRHFFARDAALELQFEPLDPPASLTLSVPGRALPFSRLR